MISAPKPSISPTPHFHSESAKTGQVTATVTNAHPADQKAPTSPAEGSRKVPQNVFWPEPQEARPWGNESVLDHDKEMAREFLVALDPSATRFTFQFISDTGSGQAEIFHSSLDDVWPKVEALNNRQRQCGVFVTPNETDFKGRKNNNIVRSRALFADADGREQVEHCESVLAASGIAASAVVRTGRGAHYYFFGNVSRDVFSDYQQRLIHRLGTDPSIKDLPRVMRLPCTLHLKDPSQPRLVTLEPCAGPRPRYSPDDLLQALGTSGLATPSSASAPSTTKEGQFTPDPMVQELFRNATDRLSDGLEADVEEIRSAALAIPPSALATEHDWVRIARALAREAAIFPKSEPQLWTILDAISRLAPGYDKDENRRRWDRYQREAHDSDRPITIATFFDLASKHGWSGHVPLAPTASVHAPAGAGAPRALPIASLARTPKKRQWLCGTYLMRGAISLLSAPGARGKTAWLITLALSCVSGKPLLGAHLFGGPKTVLYLSAEEGTEEINLRLRAAMQCHCVGEADLPGLHVIGAERWGIHLVGVNRGTPCADEEGWAALGAELDRLQPDILIADPLINFLGGADANNNSVAGLLMGRFAREAATRKMAVMIAHHVAKGRDPLAAESAMGAASFVNLSRIALSIDTLPEDKAGTVGLPPWEAKFVFRVIGTKQNYSPVKSDDDWFRLASVHVQNAEPPTYPNGDSVGVVERFTPQATGAAVFPEELLCSALQAIQDADPPLTPSAQSKTRYAVPVIAKAIAPHRGGKVSEPEAKAVLAYLMNTALAGVEEHKINRDGGRSDVRKGLFPTATGAELLRNSHAVPQSPQSPADSFAGNAVDAGGDQPRGSPAKQGGYGGKCGGEYAGHEPVGHAVQQSAPKLNSTERSGSNHPMDTIGQRAADIADPHPSMDMASGAPVDTGEPPPAQPDKPRRDAGRHEYILLKTRRRR
jgi:hypothetical protein